MRIRNTLLRKRSSRRGSAAVEFGLLIFILMFMLSGIVDFGWYMSQSEIVMRSARDGARHGAAAQDIADTSARAQARANATLTDLGYTGCTITTLTNVDGNDLAYLTTTVDCTFQPLIGMVPGLPGSIIYSFTMYNETQV